ncbi:hypothetical protein DY000_02048504 [Brassica cretica]|uniref:Uncharacterized protein n=1 Tax=Brassica cretica TaxID=69181 RepID=A0ABQ7F8D1_BRACR|nr:hypothetical protein DY000_02048504 [Brassica cretica]
MDSPRDEVLADFFTVMPLSVALSNGLPDHDNFPIARRFSAGNGRRSKKVAVISLPSESRSDANPDKEVSTVNLSKDSDVPSHPMYYTWKSSSTEKYIYICFEGHPKDSREIEFLLPSPS